MLPAERRREMARLIKNRGAVNTRELAEALGISTMAVGQGSGRPPRLIVLEHAPAGHALL